MPVQPDWIHTPDDGRGYRRVFVDGREIKQVVYADTRRGIVDANRLPLKADRWKKRAITDRFRGAVRVEFDDD